MRWWSHYCHIKYGNNRNWIYHTTRCHLDENSHNSACLWYCCILCCCNKKGAHLFPKETSLGQHWLIACYWIAILCLLAVNINELQDKSTVHSVVSIDLEYESSGIYYYSLYLYYIFLSLVVHHLLKFAIKIRREQSFDNQNILLLVPELLLHSVWLAGTGIGEATERRTTPSIGILVVDEERIRPGHWLGSVLWVSFGDLVRATYPQSFSTGT